MGQKDQLHLLPGLMARHNRTLSKLINKVDLIFGGKNFHKCVLQKFYIGYRSHTFIVNFRVQKFPSIEAALLQKLFSYE